MPKRSTFDPLTRLRRRGRAVFGAVLPVLLVGWIGAAGPCVGMAATPADETVAAVEPHAAPADHAGHARGEPAHDTTAAGEHGGAPSHGACPHCPGADGAVSDKHALCAAVDDVSDLKRKPATLGLDLVKAVLPGATGAGALPPREASRARRPDPYLRAFPSTVPLNVRHCVFII